MEKEKNVESDLGLKDEMTFVISNLVSCEEHLSMTIAETKDEKYIPILDEIRKLRAKYMKGYIGKDLPSQLWCLEKHILGTAYRLTEVAVKNISLGNKEKAIENLQDSKDMFELSFLITQMDEKKNEVKNGIDGQFKG